MKIDEPMDHFDEDTAFDEVPFSESRIVEFIRDVAPGILRPVTLIFGLLLIAIGLAVMIFASTWMILAPLSAIWIGAGGLLIYVHGSSFIVSGEIGFPTSTFLEFDGARWRCFLLITLVPSIAAVMLTVNSITSTDEEKKAEMEALYAHFEANDIQVKSKIDTGYDGLDGVTGRIVTFATGRGPSVMYVFKFDLQQKSHRQELEMIEKARKIEVNRRAPGLTQPAWVNGPYLLYPAMTMDFDSRIPRVFGEFKP